MQLICLILGKLILLCDWLCSPKSMQRDAAAQAAINEQTVRLDLYQYEANTTNDSQ